MDMEEKIKRINELYHKSKSIGLTEDELIEQQQLRKEYLKNIRGSIRSQLDNIDIKEADGTVVNVGDKIRQKMISRSNDTDDVNKDIINPDTADKYQLRKYYQKKRRELPAQASGIFSSLICENVTCLKEYNDSDTILLYKAYNNEVDTDKLFLKALSDGKKIAYPKSELVDGIPGMDFYYIDSLNQLSAGYKGIMEPDIYKYNLKKYDGSKALCIVPGVVFDEDCNRIGYGKGFYDRFLNNNTNIISIGLAFSLQVIEKINTEANDVPVDILITEDTDEYYTK